MAAPVGFDGRAGRQLCPYKAQYKSHEMLHTGGIKCWLCPFEGTHGEQMRAHRRSQHGTDRLQCTQCDTTFTHRSSLTQHIASVHSNTHIAFMHSGERCCVVSGVNAMPSSNIV